MNSLGVIPSGTTMNCQLKKKKSFCDTGLSSKAFYKHKHGLNHTTTEMRLHLAKCNAQVQTPTPTEALQVKTEGTVASQLSCLWITKQ